MHEDDVQSVTSSSSKSDDSTSSSDESGEELQGTCILSPEDFNPKKLELIKSADDCFTLSYNNDTRFYLKSGEFMGEIILYNSKFSKSVLLKKGDLLENVKTKIESLLGKKCKVTFYAKNDSACASFFAETVKNEHKQKCLHVLENKIPKLLPLEDLEEKSGCITAILKSGKIIKQKKYEYAWKLVIVEMEINPLPKGFEGYFKVVKKPKISFLGK